MYIKGEFMKIEIIVPENVKVEKQNDILLVSGKEGKVEKQIKEKNRHTNSRNTLVALLTEIRILMLQTPHWFKHRNTLLFLQL